MSVENPPHLDKVDYGTGVYFDDILGIAGTTYPVGTPSVPSNSAANTKTIADALNLRDIHVHGVFTVPDTMEHYCWYGAEHEDITDQINLNSKDVDGSNITGLIVTGTQAGTGFLTLVSCVLNALLDFQGRARFCDLYGSTIRLKNAGIADFLFCNSIHGALTVTVQAPTRASFKEMSGNLILTAQNGGTCLVRGFKGTLEIDAMTLGTLSVYANGADITINADCTGGTINIYGSATITDNSVIGCTVNDYSEQDDRAEQTAELIAADLTLVTAFGSGTLADTAEQTLCSLDAIGGTKKDVKVTVYLAGATAANIQERWYLTSVAAPATFVLKHPENAAHNPGAAAVLTREFGDLPEGLQLQFRIDSAGNDDALEYEVELSYLE